MKVIISIIVIISFLNLSSQVNFTININGCSGGTQTVSANTGTITALGYTWTSSPVGPIFSAPNSSSTTIFFPVTGTFVINLVTGSGSASNTITISPPLVITISQSSFTTCVTNNIPLFSKPILINASGASTYSWQPPFPPPLTGPTNGQTQTVRPPASTCYTVTGYTAVCSGSAVVCVTVIPQFSINVSPTNTLICKGSNIDEYAVLIVNSPTPPAFGLPASYTYSWTECGTGGLLTSPLSLSIGVSPSATCTFTAQILDSLNCVSLPAMVTVSVQNCTDILANSINNTQLNIFPNPVNDKLHFEFDNALPGGLKLVISNTVDQTIYSKNNVDLKEELDLSFLKAGIYYLKIESDKNSTVFKVVKE